SMAQAQSPHVLKGIVTDENGAPLAGVSVMVKGSHKAVLTDAEGRYTISVNSEAAVLQFSYVGYAPQDISAGDQKTLTVALTSRGGQMNDVVVTGYGQSTKK